MNKKKYTNILLVISLIGLTSYSALSQSVLTEQKNDFHLTNVNSITSLKHTDTIKSLKSLDTTVVSIPEIIENKMEEVLIESYTLASEIVDLAKEFIGVKYRSGGTSTSGMDCSGMVYSTFKKKEIAIPRSSRDLASYGTKIQKKEAKPGDLIFFKTNGRSVINHVGIITDITHNDVKFVHASVHRGVIISALSEPYYTKSFVQINRIIE